MGKYAADPHSTTVHTERLRICDLMLSTDVMPRSEIDRDTARAYRADYAAGQALPPIVAFADEGTPGRYWLADGWHRVSAQAGYDEGAEGSRDLATDPTEVEVEVHPGGKLAAMLYAASANTTHGRRRTQDDSVAAAKVAIRALTLQHPACRPTVAAVKGAARVGTDTVQRAFQELKAEPAPGAAPLPPKDPRGGKRRPKFVPGGTNSEPEDASDAYPDLDQNGMLPIIDLDDDEALDVAGDADGEQPRPPRKNSRQRTEAEKANDCLRRLQSAAKTALNLSPHTAAKSWRLGEGPPDLADVLDELAEDIATFATAVRAATAQEGVSDDGP